MKVINGTNIRADGTFDPSNTTRCIAIEEFDAKYRHFAIEPGDIVVASSGTLGKAARVGAEHLPMMMNTSVIRFRSKCPDRLDDGFLFAWLRSQDFLDQALGMATGAAQQNFGPSHVKLMTMPLPSLKAQRRIASTLSAYDDLIENNTRRIAILEEMARRIYEEWFVHYRFPGHESVRRVETELGLLPEGWSIGALKSVCDTSGGVQTGPFGSQLHKSDYAEQGVPVLMPKDLIDFRINATTVARVSEAVADRLARHRCQPNDIVYGRRGDIGRRAFIMSHQAGWLCGTGCLRIRPDHSKIDPWYLFNFLGQDSTRGLIEGRAHGVTMPNLNTKLLESVPIAVPPRSLQHDFTAAAFPMSELIESLLAKNTNLRTTRDLLLPRLISGELDVSDLPLPEEAAA